METEITEAYILDEEGNFLDTPEVKAATKTYSKLANLTSQIKSLILKSEYASSNSDTSEADSRDNNFILDKEGRNLVEPPIDPEILSLLIKVDEVHKRCCDCKVTDSILREYHLLPKDTITDETPDEEKKLIQSQVTEIREFIEDCSFEDGFEGVLRKAGIDLESIGWCAIEVVRSLDMKIKKLFHIPAERVRVISGRRGYAEICSDDIKIYYQLFGQKVRSKNRINPITKQKEYYSPSKDGELNADNAEFYLLNKENGSKTTSFKKSANEILFLRKHHPATIHYGIPDIIPAVPYIFGNIHIRDFFLQFFENNAVPQYAVIIEGGKLSAEVKQTIQKFFTQDIKGNAHKTLILPVPSTTGEVRVRFEKLSADEKEGSFQTTKGNNQTSIMTAHGVSPAIIGINETANLGSGKGLSQAENYKNRITVPSQLYWARELNKLFRLGLGIDKVIIEFEPLDIRDMKEEMEMFTKYLVSGVLTINEVRKFAKLGDPISGGDRAFIVVSQDVFFIDDMSKAPSSILEKLELTKAALEAKIKDKTDTALNNEGKKINRDIGNEPQKDTTFQVGNPT